MKITVNGKELVFEKVVTVSDMLKAQNVEMQEYVTVQINDDIIDREDFDTRTVKDNDVVEFLYFMGGGTR